MGLIEKTVKSTKWNAFATIITMGLQVVQLAVLTRLLDKSDFGIIAIASLALSFTDIFSELGMTVALIHKQNITQREYSSVFWMNFFVHSGVCFITILLSPLIAKFYEEPILFTIISLLSLKILFNAFGRMFQTIKIKEMDFGFISKVKITSAIAGFLCTTFLAYYGFGIMSIVYGQLINTGSSQLTYAIAGLKKQKILSHFSLDEIKGFLNIGIYQLGAQILDFLAGRIDLLLIGKFFSMEELGIYNIAKDLILKPYSIINRISSSVLSSAFAKIQDSIDAIRINYRKLVELATLLNCFIYGLLFAFGDLIVSVLYAPSFADVATIVRILSIFGLVSAITSQGSPVLIAMGRTDLGLQWTAIRTLMSTICLAVTATFGIYAVAYGQSLLSIISLFVYFLVVLKPMLKMSVYTYIGMFSHIIIVSTLITAPFYCVVGYCDLSSFYQILLALFFSCIFIFYIRTCHSDVYDKIIRLFIPHSN